MIYTLFCSCRKTRPFRINRLGTLCAGAKTSTPLFSVHCALFCKTGGVGTQHFRAELRSRRHMHHVAPLSPVASLGCAYFPSPRGCTTPRKTKLLIPKRLGGIQFCRLHGRQPAAQHTHQDENPG